MVYIDGPRVQCILSLCAASFLEYAPVYSKWQRCLLPLPSTHGTCTMQCPTSTGRQLLRQLLRRYVLFVYCICSASVAVYVVYMVALRTMCDFTVNDVPLNNSYAPSIGRRQLHKWCTSREPRARRISKPIIGQLMYVKVPFFIIYCIQIYCSSVI